jgi:FMN phosphatase YigB (HAD superfamily)
LFARVRLLLIAAFVALIATACQVGITVDVTVAENGSGLVAVGVSLDEEALAELPDLSDVLVLDDMVEAGWVVRPPEIEDDGLTWIRASKPFNSPEQLTPIMEEIAGEGGAFRDFVLLREEAFAELDFTLTGTVDLTEGATVFTDAAVAEVLGESDDVAARVAELEEEYGPASENVTVTLTVNLPGGAQGESADGGGAVWVVSFDDTEATQIAASASDENVSAKLWRWVGIAALILFAIAAVVQLVAWLLDRRSKKRALPGPHQAGGALPLAAQGQMPQAPAPVAVGAAAPPPRRQLSLLVIDPVAVAFDLGDNPQRRLVPFVRSHNSEVPDDEIVETYRQATLGRLTSAELWTACGVEGNPAKLDKRYISAVELRSGASEFLVEMTRREMPVAFLGNTLAEWAQLLRSHHGVETVGLWTISGEVGVRNPDPAIYEALRRQTGTPFESCLMIDGRVINLDAAKTLGMSTALFTETQPSPDQSPGHPVVTQFSEFFRRRTGQ